MYVSNQLDRDTINMLNLLTLLRDKPMTYEELWMSGYFKRDKSLGKVIHRLHRANCIEWMEAAKIWVILGRGITLLSFYPNWRALPVEVLDSVLPIGWNGK